MRIRNNVAMCTALLFGTVMLELPATADVPAWKPKASERLVKMPSGLLQQSIERDFADSALARALEQSRDDANYKAQTLRDLKEASDRAEGEVRTELRHQYLAEKQAFISIVGEQHSLERRRVEARVKLYGDILEKLERRGAGVSPEARSVVADQQAAVSRFEGSVTKVDLELFGSGAAEQSRYAQAFARNMDAIEKLVAAIDTHPMQSQATLNGSPVSKQEYVTHMLAEAESDLAILDQEESVLGFMAKLVALDAMALAEGIDADDFTPQLGIEAEPSVLVSSVEFFVE